MCFSGNKYEKKNTKDIINLSSAESYRVIKVNVHLCATLSACTRCFMDSQKSIGGDQGH